MSRGERIFVWVPYPLVMLLLFFFGISYPQLSQLTVYVLVFVMAVNWRGKIVPDFIQPFAILIAFCVTYYLLLYSYGFIELAQALHRPLLFVGFYSFGYALTRANTPRWPYMQMWLLMSLISGFIVFTYVSAYFNPFSAADKSLRTVEIENIWRSGETLLATGFGLFASLGLCFLPVALFGKDSSIKSYQYFILVVVVGSIFLASFSASSLFQNRSPLIALGLAIVASLFIFLAKRNAKRTTKAVVILLICLLVGATIVNYAAIMEAHIFVSFAEKGLSTPRYNAWKNLIAGLPTHLLGGRQIDLGGLEYVHNIWLDVANDSGIFPFLFLLAFHTVHVRNIFKISTSRLPLLVTVGFSCTAVSFLVGFVNEPALQFSAPYFAASCFFLGMTRRLSFDIDDLARKTTSRGLMR